MVAFYFSSATMLGRSHHWSFFPVLGFIVNPLGIIIFSLFSRNLVTKQAKEKGASFFSLLVDFVQLKLTVV